MIKYTYILLTLLFIFSHSLMAHYLWIETNPTGKIGKAQEVRVYFGEYTWDLRETPGGERFEPMKAFKVWVVSPSGEKTDLAFKQGSRLRRDYTSTFTPEEKGTYTLLLNNDEIEVIDYTEYDFGIFKTHYHSIAKVVVGDGLKETIADNPNGITLVDLSTEPLATGKKLTFKVLYKGELLVKGELDIYVADQWGKKLYTDENGMVSLTLPWNTKYVIEAAKKEEVPGEYNGKPYQFIYHCVTYCIPL